MQSNILIKYATLFTYKTIVRQKILFRSLLEDPDFQLLIETTVVMNMMDLTNYKADPSPHETWQKSECCDGVIYAE